MYPTRRELFALACFFLPIGGRAGYAQSPIVPRKPEASTLKSGDLLWPKKPGAIIPYHGGIEQSMDDDRRNWLRERDDFLERTKDNTTPEVRGQRARLANTTYNDFRLQYLAGRAPGSISNYSGGDIAAVGHVAIVDVDNGKPHVVEALVAPGVVRTSYADWLASRPGEIVWHGRLKRGTDSDRAKVAAESKKYLGRPYNFFEFDLANDSGFYCSKLVWLSILKSMNFAVDGDPNPNRNFWLSPKQILYSDNIALLLDQGSYGMR